ncbi:hypothetical protein HELRODRAFT_161339 [Helobdella robusta]|uniref:SET domain-containing protein n=1 Tax=Helobdella robusta TaxID=6412 RepID=T1ERC9_HELRO|nr:hypothetical protein HELRODRAFT_161339 [Helobdella robusta]ESO02104.1 hypothetical protein HELRODRAFT_161339 [Helobdella robusta]
MTPLWRIKLVLKDHCYAAGLPGSVDEDLTYTPDSLAAFVDIEDVSCNTTVVTGDSFFNSVAQESHSKKEKHTSKLKNIKKDDEDEYAGSVTRCICDFQHDDGFMISCDRCSVWQHVECMGLNRSSIPETYLCDLCQPRNVDKRRAIRIQTKKKEEMEFSSESSDGGIQLPEVSRRGRKRKLRRDEDDDESELTSICSNKKARKKSISNDKIDFHNENVYSKSYQYKRPRFNSSGKTVDSTACLSIKDNMNNRNITIDHSIEDIRLNTYTNNVSYLLSILSNNASDEFNDQNFNDADNQSNVKNSTSSPSSSSSSWLNPALLKEQLLKVKYRATDVALNTKGVVSMETIRPGQVVGEFCGMIMTREEYEKSNSYDPLYTSVLNYTLHKNLTICVDARQWNNPMKYIRPSCSPNSKVVHMIEGNTVRLFVFASKNITSGKEITLPFLADYQNSYALHLFICVATSCYSYLLPLFIILTSRLRINHFAKFILNSLVEMKCACGKASCAVTKFYKAKSKNRFFLLIQILILNFIS